MAPTMNPLPEPDSQHLRAAEGWLELGDHLEANEELERITPELRAHPDVLEVRWHIYAHAKTWEACVNIALTITTLAHERADGWILCSYALHKLKLPEEAFNQLAPVADRFPKVWTIPYNLACYCAQMGRLEESQRWLKKAMAIDGHAVEQAATNDPDLKPLWDGMGDTFWKRTD
jgi:tetratricopeptide (TPR) repeat protein